jgi:hypothetical protein
METLGVAGGVQVGVVEGTGQHSDVERNRKNNNFAEQERDNRKRGIK